MSEEIEIFVRLLDEKVDVWRPVCALRKADNIFEIMAQEYDQRAEKWEFEPGDQVACEFISSSTGRIFAAVRAASI